MDIYNDLNGLKQRIAQARCAGHRVSFVPTMGGLHEGHLSLVRQGVEMSDLCVVSIYLNPTQFAVHEDLDDYPKPFEEDCQKLREVGADVLWAPSTDIMYPKGACTNIMMQGIGTPLEGEYRPHFFNGVATVVTKLLLQVMPDIAIFGEKDYQQIMVVKQLVRDFHIPVEIIPGATVRDENGLALASRNGYLNEDEYRIAIHLNKIMFQMREKLGDHRVGDQIAAIEDIESWAHSEILHHGFDRIDYCTIRDAHTLHPVTPQTIEARIFAAAWVGKTRLIDNISV